MGPRKIQSVAPGRRWLVYQWREYQKVGVYVEQNQTEMR
jgi:hypothetical protein